MMTGQLIVTIGRESGSGGLEIGQKLAIALGVRCYDKEILTEAAKNSGFAEQIFTEYDESSKKNMLLAWTSGFSSIGYSMPLSTQIYLAQFKAIREIAAKGSAVFVGRCSDYVLKDLGYNLVNVFIHSPIEGRIARVMKRMEISKEKAEEFIHKTDKERASYYNYYTEHKWGRMENYDIVTDSSKIALDDIVSLLIDYIALRTKE